MTNMKNKFYFLLLFCFLFSLTSVQAQEKATPKSGEGISTFLLRHNRGMKKYYDDFIRLNKDKLGKNNSLQLGVSYIIPPAKSSRKSDGSSSEDEASEAESSNVDHKTSRSKRRGTVTSSKENDTSEKESSHTDKKSTRSKKKGSVYEPLFGKSLANVKVKSSRLSGACFYVVSGHGGPDPGAIGQIGDQELHEDEYAYDIALRLARNLMEEGAEVRIIIQDEEDGIRNEAYLNNSKREVCMGDPIPLNQVERLRQRCDKINASYRKDRKNYKYCRSIFIHVDSRSKGKQTDVFFYHSSKKAESKRLANNMKATFESRYDRHQPNRGFTGTVSARDLFVLSHASPAAVFVELGNIQNTFDQKRLIMNSNRRVLASWLLEGFLKDYKELK